ncbi:MAG: transporter [Kiritimatiellae bacterium]|nr:transporter [Kiritimatiellia bacterium]
MKKSLLAVVTVLAATAGFGAGFGLYEASSRGNAMGGALVGKPGDATANYYNPAALTDMTNMSVYAGFTYINPFCDSKVDRQSQPKMNAGWFFAPTFYLSAPITDDLSVGWGNYAEYGLGTKYKRDWALAYDTTETTIEQYTLNPNIAYKLTDWWSISAGLRVSYITFENRGSPLAGLPIPGTGLRSHLKGTDWGMGYMLGTKFKITERLHAGVVYRSRIDHTIKGDFDMYGTTMGIPTDVRGPASAKLALPASVTTGINWDITDDWRVGATIIWTEWRSIDTINFCLPSTYSYPEKLKFDNAFRYGMGTEYDFTDWLQGRLGYVYDLDPSHEKHGTTMLPAGDRHIAASGLGFKLSDNLRLDVGLSFIFMERSSRDIHDRNAAKMGIARKSNHWECRNSFSYLVSAGVTYNF